ncbi:DUF2171 domain-containing protein [Sphingomonas colocasiae]|nr:DUF2171 domain-containing protein [Sphingomonas colocasiae]
MGYYRNERGFQTGSREERDYRDHRFRDDRGASAYGDRLRGYDRERYDQPRGRSYESWSDRERSRYGRADMPRDYDYDDRGFFTRAGDEVRSWFGDEDAERRRELDARHDERYEADRPQRGSRHHDPSYNHWRNRQIAALDRDYDEYRRETQSHFDNEFGSWRSRRSSQRDSLQLVAEHMEVVGSDGAHVGTVDKVRGDRVILTKGDTDAGGHHHSIPSAWIQSVDDRVTISKSADEAQRAWRDEERRGALFGDVDDGRSASYSYARFMSFY